jgi:hypothetical protein
MAPCFQAQQEQGALSLCPLTYGHEPLSRRNSRGKLAIMHLRIDMSVVSCLLGIKL